MTTKTKRATAREPSRTDNCEQCGKPTSFERRDPKTQPPEGEVCEQCGMWVCPDCTHPIGDPCPQPPEHDAGLRDGRRLHTNDCVRQRAKFGARSKAGDVCSCDADAEQPSDPDAVRIAQLESEGLTHSDAVGVVEAEKLARQPEPAAGEERGEPTPAPWETSVIGSEDGDQWDICGEGGGDTIADLSGCGDSELQEANAKLIIRAVNTHMQLVAALEQARELLAKAEVHHGYCLEIDTALRLAKDGE